jgi:hypothetical protein
VRQGFDFLPCSIADSSDTWVRGVIIPGMDGPQQSAIFVVAVSESEGGELAR